MKKIITLLAVVGLVVFSACEGPQGPPGMPGQDGFDGQDGEDGLIAEVYEVQNVNFTSANSYNPIIPLNPAIFPSDMVLLYRLGGSTQSGADIWLLSPELYYLADGTLDFGYNYDFTINDVSIVLDGRDLGGLSSNYRLNQVFRIVIIPGYVTGKSANKPDYSDYKAVIAKYGIDDSKVKKIYLK